MIVADTDVWINYLNGKGEAERIERLLRLGVLSTTVINRFELLSGAKTERQRNRLLDLFEALSSLPLDDAAADAASEVRRSLEQTGASIGMGGSLIAGIAISNSRELLTRN